MTRVSWTYDWVNSSLFRKLARSWTSTRDFVISKEKKNSLPASGSNAGKIVKSPQQTKPNKQKGELAWKSKRPTLPLPPTSLGAFYAGCTTITITYRHSVMLYECTKNII